VLALAWAVPAAAAAPDWLKQLEATALPPHDDQTNAVQLLDETEVTFLSDGSQRTIQRAAFRILRREGQRFGVAKAFYNKDGKVVRMKGWGLPRTGKPFEVDVKDSVETALVPGTEGSLITTARMKVMTVPAASPGNLIGYEIETTSRPAIVGELWSPQFELPVVRARYTVTLPTGWNFRAKWFNGAPVNPQATGATTWQWELRDLPAIKGEEAMPETSTLARHMVLAIDAPVAARSSFRDWDEMGRWFSKLVTARSEVTPEVTRLIAMHGQGAAPTYERIRSLAQAVQKDVRYVQVTLDATGYQPRSPQEVLATGYGDCKDKANTLRLLLEQIGVHSQIVLVNTNRGVVRGDTLPSAIFNHAVIAIQLPPDTPTQTIKSLSLIEDGKGSSLLLFDPTDDLTPFGRVGEHLRAGELLLVGSDGARLVHAPTGKPADNGVDRRISVKLAADGSLSGEARESWRGVWANYEREKAKAASQNQDLKRPVELRLAGAVANYRIDSAAVSNRDDIEKPFEWQYSFTARDYAKVAGDLLMLRPRVLGSKSSSLLETGEPRVNAVAFDATHVDSDVMTVEIPAGFEVESLPDPVNVDIGFAAYRSRTRVEGRALVYERSFEQKELDLPLDRIGALRDLYAAIDRDERSMAVLKAKATR
jgi:Domain of Unknown Function with PDB structure (DUF3857)/Transglutaminase-like superfamily